MSASLDAGPESTRSSNGPCSMISFAVKEAVSHLSLIGTHFIMCAYLYFCHLTHKHYYS